MSTRGAVDLLTVPREKVRVNQEAEFLSRIAPRQKPWDIHRGEADEVTEVYAGSQWSRHRRYADRVAQCSQIISFARDPPNGKAKPKLKLKTAWFCRVRHCPVCQWRRSLMWQARVYRALPALVRDYPTVRFLFITFTVRNCPVNMLRSTLALMGKAWGRLTVLQCWPAIGWVRAVEITRSKDGTAHPHYHCLLMVKPEYFGNGYLKQRQWAEVWQTCLRIPYRPIVDVRVVRLDHKPWRRKEEAIAHHIWGAITEILKYSIKPSDMVRDHAWFLTLVDEVWKTRAVAIGGVLKKYIRERERENLFREPGEEEPPDEAERLFFGWKPVVRKYQRLQH